MTRFVPYNMPGSYGITTELWRVQRSGALIEQVDPVKVGPMTITCNENVAVRRSATIQTDDPHHFTPFVDYLMPFLYITDPEGNTIGGPQGLYIVVPSGTQMDAADITGTVDCRDLCQMFSMDNAPGLQAEAGLDRGAIIRQMAIERGLVADQIQVPDFGVLQPEDRVWEPGTSAMEALTDLATGSNWYQPWFSNRGQLVTSPYLPLTDVPPTHTFTNEDDDHSADIEGPIQGEPDWNRLANRVTVRKLGDQEHPTISYTAENNSADSPSSFQNLGVWISKTVDNYELVDEDAARVQAEQQLSESSSQYMKVSVPTFPVVDAELHHTIRLEVTRGPETIYSGNFWRSGYTLTLDGGNTTMNQSLVRVEEWR